MEFYFVNTMFPFKVSTFLSREIVKAKRQLSYRVKENGFTLDYITVTCVLNYGPHRDSRQMYF